MARAPQQGTGPITVWMIIFAALWLASTVFLIVLYTGQEELAGRNDSLELENSRLISDQEKRSIELIKPMDERNTAVGILENARRRTAELATGGGDDDPTTVRTKRDNLYGEIRRDGLLAGHQAIGDISFLEGMTALYAAFRSQGSELKEANDRLVAMDAELRQLTDGKAAMQSEMEKREAEMTERIAQIEAERAAYREQRDEAVARLESEFETWRERSDEEVKSERLRSAQLERDLADLRQRFLAQEEKFGALLIGPEALATARRPDGSILTAVPGDPVVYINLGGQNRLTLGLRFAVYSASAGIPADGRAKAQIEVVSISQKSAECRIVQVAPNEIIVEGDVVANPIYDPSRALTFLVIGDFDLNRDGVPDSGGSAVVESLVAEWGGTVTNELTATTDFVVMGSPPRQPRATASRDLTPEQAQRNEAARRDWEHYVEILSAAKALSVPMLTQEVFLNFLGYRGRFTQR